MLSRPDSAGLSHVSVGSWQVSHVWLVQGGFLGLISELVHHHFCCSQVAKASHKASQDPRDGEVSSTTGREELKVTLQRAGVQGWEENWGRFYNQSTSIAFSDYEGAVLRAPHILHLTNSFTHDNLHRSKLRCEVLNYL